MTHRPSIRLFRYVLQSYERVRTEDHLSAMQLVCATRCNERDATRPQVRSELANFDEVVLLPLRRDGIQKVMLCRFERDPLSYIKYSTRLLFQTRSKYDIWGAAMINLKLLELCDS